MKNETEFELKNKKLLHCISILKQNKVPLDSKGEEAMSLKFEIEDYENLSLLLDALEQNDTFKGNLSIYSSKFKDINGLTIANIIKKNKISSLTIWNRNCPFSDRIACNIGDALESNTSLKHLMVFLEIDDISPIHIIKFLSNPQSNLATLGYLKVTQKMFETVTQFLNKNSVLNRLLFYYEPLKEVNLLYQKEISDDIKDELAHKIENDSNITEVNIIPLEEKFIPDINEKLTNDIDIINKTLQFSCEIVKKEKDSQIFIDKIFSAQNKVIDSILEKIDRKEGKELKNSIVSVRSYLDRAIGESLNQALYDLEVQRERFPEKKELFTAKGSIRYVAQYLLNNKA